MTYKEAIDWLYATQQFGIKLGLEQPRRLLDEFDGYPADRVKVVHVAGTNGKGSTCAMIDALARACGLCSGLFTSPHLIDFRERVRVNGSEISEQETARSLTELRALVSDWDHHPTFFELTLALAMRHFKQQGCELIVLETGMGGRLDATTAVPADIAVITPVDMDHSQWLGETLPEIAAEKAGIMVAGKPVISSGQAPEVVEVLQGHANKIHSPIEFITEPFTDCPVALPGKHQRHNASLALAAAGHAGIAPDKEKITHALGTVYWPGRFERCTAPDLPCSLILDAAHNPQAAQALAETWQNQYKDQKAVIVFGGVKDKNTKLVLSALSPIAAHIHLTPINSPRSLGTEELADVVCPEIPHTIHHSITDAISSAGQQASESPILICGSIFLIGQVKAMLAARELQPSSQ